MLKCDPRSLLRTKRGRGGYRNSGTPFRLQTASETPGFDPSARDRPRGGFFAPALPVVTSRSVPYLMTHKKDGKHGSRTEGIHRQPGRATEGHQGSALIAAGADRAAPHRDREHPALEGTGRRLGSSGGMRGALPVREPAATAATAVMDSAMSAADPRTVGAKKPARRLMEHLAGRAHKIVLIVKARTFSRHDAGPVVRGSLAQATGD